jgi:hypothetical protein
MVSEAPNLYSLEVGFAVSFRRYNHKKDQNQRESSSLVGLDLRKSPIISCRQQATNKRVLITCVSEHKGNKSRKQQ